MSESSLNVEIRQQGGKGAARKLRAAGRIPAVVYGRNREALALTVDPTALQRLLTTSHAGMNTLIDLQGEGAFAGRTVLVKDLQRDPVRGRYLHADFYEVDLTQTVEVDVPIHVRGTPRGVQFGGILDHSLREVELECLPRAIPDEIVVDVSELEIGDVVHVRDLALPTGVELRTDPDLSVLQVSLPAAEEEPAEAAEVAEGEEVVAAEGAEGEEAERARAEGGDEKTSGD